VSRVSSLAVVTAPPTAATATTGSVEPPPESGPALARPAPPRVAPPAKHALPAAAHPPRTRMPPPTDRDLVDRARSGDPHAFGELVRRHQRRLHRLALHMLRDRAEAEDITQEAFVRAYGALARFDGRSEPYTWLYRIAVNLSLNAIRARKTARRSGGLPSDDPRLDGIAHETKAQSVDPTDAGKRQLYGALAQAIDDLTETLRTTLILVCIDGRSHEEAAQILGAPEGTIAWRVHEARRKLREALAARGFDLVDALRESGGCQ
jgi:RNA polymerase sigma-70 factor, ECF subfamily